MDLPIELKHPRKGLINIKNKDQKCFLWCHVRHINPSKEHRGKIEKVDKKIAEKLDYDGIEFPVKEKDFDKIEIKKEKDFDKIEIKTKFVLTCLVTKMS